MVRLILTIAITAVLTGITIAAEPNPKLAESVAVLVRDLDHEDFDRRQFAHAQLVELGPAILPYLERNEPFGPETGFRIKKIRIAVAGIDEQLRTLLIASVPPKFDPDASERTRQLVAEHSVKAGDFLLSIIANPKHELVRPAALAFIYAWDLMSAEQIRMYLEQTLEFDFAQRRAYPRGIDAMIGVGYRFRHGFGSPPQNEKFGIATVTYHKLDGQEYGKPYRYPHVSSGCTTAWVRTKDLALGQHSFTAEVIFKVQHNGTTVKGNVLSKKYMFEMLPANTPDDLIAPHDPEVDKQIRTAVVFAETAERANGKPLGLDKTDWWAPQVTWTEKDGTPNGVHLPIWRLEKPLPVDLAFDVYLRIEGTNEEFFADMLIVAKGTERNLGNVYVKDAQALAKGRSGFVKVRVVLKPSRAMALTDPKVTRYFPGEIVSEPLRIHIGPKKVATE